jgi:galactokinase
LVHIKYTGDSENPVVVDTIPYPEELGLVGVTVMDPQDNRSLGKRYNEMAEMIDMALQTLKSISDPGGFETREIDGIAALTLQQFGVFKERFRKASLRRVSDEVSDKQAYVDRIIARVEHVITEVARVREFVAMLQGLDLEDEEQVNQVRARIAELANESGESAIVRHGVATGVPQLPVLLSVLRCSEMRVLGARNHGGGGNKATMLYMGRADALKLRDYLNTYIKNGLSDAKVNEILQMCQENYGLTDMTEEALRTILEEFKERELDIDIVVPGRGSSVLWSGFEHR